MELNPIKAKLAAKSEPVPYFEYDAEGHPVVDPASGQYVIKGYSMDVEFVTTRLKSERLGPFNVYHEARHFLEELPLETVGMLTLRIVRNKRKREEGYYMSVELIDFEPN